MTNFSEFMESKCYIESDATAKFEGNIYLLVDKEVHSSSVQFSIFSKNSGFATLIGETRVLNGGYSKT